MANCHLDCGKEIMVSCLTFKINSNLVLETIKNRTTVTSVSPLLQPLK